MRYDSIKFFLGLLLLPLLLSCSQREEAPEPPLQEPPDGKLTAYFTLTLPKPTGTSATRAEGALGPGYDTGEGLESYIDLEGGDFRFYFFDLQDRYIEALSVTSITPVGEASTTRDYEVAGNVSEKLRGATVKIMALANWKVYGFPLEPGVTTISDICTSDASIYRFGPDLMEISERNTIPLYGITNPRTLNFDGAGMANLDRIYMLRAFAKVEVVLSRPDNSYLPLVEKDPVRLTAYNTLGYAAPKDVLCQNDYMHYDYDSDYVASPHVPADSYHSQTIPLRKVGENRYLGYFPEYRNIGRPENERVKIRLRFEGDAEDESLEFSVYRDNEPTDTRMDLLRNVWYQFRVSKRLRLDVTVQMVPYAEVPLEPSFGLGGDYRLEPIYDQYGSLLYWFDPISGKYYHDREGTNQFNPGELNVNTDPTTGWNLMRDFNGAFICFNNAGGEGTTGEPGYYAYDGKTRLRNPSDGDLYYEKRWYSIQDFSDGFLFYYQDHWSSDCYATPDTSTRIYPPFPEGEYDVEGNFIEWLPYYLHTGRVFVGYLHLPDKKWYDRKKENVIPDPFLSFRKS